MLGHMQKVNHFWAQIKKTQNVSYEVFAQSTSYMNIILAHRCRSVFQFSFLKVGINYCPLNECCEN